MEENDYHPKLVAVEPKKVVEFESSEALEKNITKILCIVTNYFIAKAEQLYPDKIGKTDLIRFNEFESPEDLFQHLKQSWDLIFKAYGIDNNTNVRHCIIGLPKTGKHKITQKCSEQGALNNPRDTDVLWHFRQKRGGSIPPSKDYNSSMGLETINNDFLFGLLVEQINLFLYHHQLLAKFEGLSIVHVYGVVSTLFSMRVLSRVVGEILPLSQFEIQFANIFTNLDRYHYIKLPKGFHLSDNQVEDIRRGEQLRQVEALRSLYINAQRQGLSIQIEAFNGNKLNSFDKWQDDLITSWGLTVPEKFNINLFFEIVNKLHPEVPRNKNIYGLLYLSFLPEKIFHFINKYLLDWLLQETNFRIKSYTESDGTSRNKNVKFFKILKNKLELALKI